MTQPARREGEKPPVPVLLALATFGYLALLVAGLGFASLLLDDDVISTPGFGVVPAYVAAAAAIAVFAGSLWGALRPRRPSFLSVLAVALLAASVHALALGLAVVIAGAGVGAALGAMAEVLTGWVSPVVGLAAALASWFAIAVRRTEARPPRWPWEREDE